MASLQYTLRSGLVALAGVASAALYSGQLSNASTTPVVDALRLQWVAHAQTGQWRGSPIWRAALDDQPLYIYSKDDLEYETLLKKAMEESIGTNEKAVEFDAMWENMFGSHTHQIHHVKAHPLSSFNKLDLSRVEDARVEAKKAYVAGRYDRANAIWERLFEEKQARQSLVDYFDDYQYNRARELSLRQLEEDEEKRQLAEAIWLSQKPYADVDEDETPRQSRLDQREIQTASLLNSDEVEGFMPVAVELQDRARGAAEVHTAGVQTLEDSLHKAHHKAAATQEEGSDTIDAFKAYENEAEGAPFESFEAFSEATHDLLRSKGVTTADAVAVSLDNAFLAAETQANSAAYTGTNGDEVRDLILEKARATAGAGADAQAQSYPAHRVPQSYTDALPADQRVATEIRSASRWEATGTGATGHDVEPPALKPGLAGAVAQAGAFGSTGDFLATAEAESSEGLRDSLSLRSSGTADSRASKIPISTRTPSRTSQTSAFRRHDHELTGTWADQHKTSGYRDRTTAGAAAEATPSRRTFALRQNNTAAHDRRASSSTERLTAGRSWYAPRSQSEPLIVKVQWDESTWPEVNNEWEQFDFSLDGWTAREIFERTEAAEAWGRDREANLAKPNGAGSGNEKQTAVQVPAPARTTSSKVLQKSHQPRQTVDRSPTQVTGHGVRGRSNSEPNYAVSTNAASLNTFPSRTGGRRVNQNGRKTPETNRRRWRY